MQFVERRALVARRSACLLLLGVDGISLFLVLLTTLLMPIAIYFSNLYVNEQVGPIPGADAHAWRRP